MSHTAAADSAGLMLVTSMLSSWLKHVDGSYLSDCNVVLRANAAHSATNSSGLVSESGSTLLHELQCSSAQEGNQPGGRTHLNDCKVVVRSNNAHSAAHPSEPIAL